MTLIDQFQATISYAAADGDTPLISVSGEVDIATLPELRDVITTALDVAPTVAVSLSAVTFIDTATVRLLAELAHTARRQHKRLTIVASSSQVRHVLSLIDHVRAYPPSSRRIGGHA